VVFIDRDEIKKSPPTSKAGATKIGFQTFSAGITFGIRLSALPRHLHFGFQTPFST
jgi:hypothetical protein